MATMLCCVVQTADMIAVLCCAVQTANMTAVLCCASLRCAVACYIVLHCVRLVTENLGCVLNSLPRSWQTLGLALIQLRLYLPGVSH